MTSTQHTGIVISAKDADAWHVKICKIMADRGLNFSEAVNVYIEWQQPRNPAAVFGTPEYARAQSQYVKRYD